VEIRGLVKSKIIIRVMGGLVKNKILSVFIRVNPWRRKI